jgi:hypothetical protein
MGLEEPLTCSLFSLLGLKRKGSYLLSGNGYFPRYCLKNSSLSKVKIHKARISKIWASAAFTEILEFMESFMLYTFAPPNT